MSFTKRLIAQLASLLVVYAVFADGASGVIGADLTFAWTASPSPEVSQYNLYRITNGVTNKVMTVSAPATTATLTNVSAGSYTFYVTAANSWGESVPSNLVSTPAGLPPAPSNLKLTLTITIPSP